MVRKVIVIGGGIAGLTAACRLSRNKNFNVILLEASDRIGGRVHSVKDAYAAGETLEKGAQWIHGEGSIFHLVKSHGDNWIEDDPFLDRMETNTDFGTSSGVNVTAPETLKKYLELFKIMRDGPTKEDMNDISYGNWFLRKIKANDLSSNVHVSAFINWLERLQVSIDASDSWYDTSVRGQLEYETCPGCPTILWTHSYQTLLNIILNENPTDAVLPSWIKLNRKVEKVDYSKKPIVTKIEDGTCFESDAVIVTVPLGVLKADHHKLFEPALPSVKVQTIEHLGFGTVNKIHVYFEKVWWESEWLGLNLLWVEEDQVEFPPWATNLLGFYTSKTCPHTLTSWITGPHARELEKIHNADLTDMILRILRRFTKNNKIPRPQVAITTWFSNPNFRGSYSFRSIQSEEKDVWARDLAAPIAVAKDGLLCFAGEATHDSFYSTVHGAYDTGIREADRLIQFYCSETAL